MKVLCMTFFNVEGKLIGKVNRFFLMAGKDAGPIGKLNHDPDVTTTDVAMSCHDTLLPEIPCQF